MLRGVRGEDEEDVVSRRVEAHMSRRVSQK